MYHILSRPILLIRRQRQVLNTVRTTRYSYLHAQEFIPRLKRHLLRRLALEKGEDLEESSFSDEQLRVFLFEHDRLYRHQIMRVNYTTYDVRRGQDIIHVGTDHCHVMVHANEDGDADGPAQGASSSTAREPVLFWIAPTNPEGFDFLLVDPGGLGGDPEWESGWIAKRLERIGFVPQSDEGAFDFLDPADVIRGCHLIPAFAEGRTRSLLGPSMLARHASEPQDDSDWERFYVNRFVDRDMFMRYLGGAVGHGTPLVASVLELCRGQLGEPREYAMADGLDAATLNPPGHGTTSALTSVETGPGQDEDPDDDNDEDPDDAVDYDSDVPFALLSVRRWHLQARRPLVIDPFPELFSPQLIPISNLLHTPLTKSRRTCDELQLCSVITASSSSSPSRVPLSPRVPSFLDVEILWVDANPLSAMSSTANTSCSASHPVAPALIVELTATGRQRATAQDPIKSYGRHFVRTVDMFLLPAVALYAGMQHDPERPMEEYSPEEQRNYEAWEALLRIIPNLITILSDSNADQPLRRVSAALLAGCSAARSDDTRSIKIAIIEWLSNALQQAKVTLNPLNKAQRGFNNPVTGRLLCPMVLDYQDDEVRKLLETHQATVDGQPVDGSHWPVFAYDEAIYNPVLPWKSFLRGRLIIQAFRHIFTSPSSATAEDDAISNAPDRSTRNGNAALHGMTHVTPGSIIYCATHVHFALSNVAVFNKNSKTNDTIIFYGSIVEWFQEPRYASPVKELLAWWDRTVFPTHHRAQASLTNHGLQSMNAAMEALEAGTQNEA
ncbi:hypothetical protein NUW54_g5831 [Trametes sanguinea]|uniref:Uncharacterized protein n=1 Tax=Trametes sanguinea TaxID=158606 RepID=A0ACC1PWP8_9APHY|nr:hypothetical protein NUW54_g5831 [Trametes sanguinea]